MNRTRGRKRQRVALVTGAAGGIGSAIAEQLLDDGYTVIANVRVSNASSDQLSKKHKNKPFFVYEADITIESEVKAMLRWVRGKFDCVDVLVNNAGVIYNKSPEPLSGLSMEKFDEYIAVNVRGGLSVTQQALPLLKRSKSGRVLFINSTLSFIGSPARLGYTISKTANIGAVRALALELASYGICVNGIVPGYIQTRMTDFKGTRLAEKIKRIPLRRFGTPTEVAKFVSYLASPESAYITGQQLHINGGLFLA